MIVKADMGVTDDIDFVFDYCETGSQIKIVNKVGVTLFSLDAIPPAKLELLKRRLDEEIDKGPKLNPFNEVRRKPALTLKSEPPVITEGM